MKNNIQRIVVVVVLVALLVCSFAAVTVSALRFDSEIGDYITYEDLTDGDESVSLSASESDYLFEIVYQADVVDTYSGNRTCYLDVSLFPDYAWDNWVEVNFYPYGEKVINFNTFYNSYHMDSFSASIDALLADLYAVDGASLLYIRLYYYDDGGNQVGYDSVLVSDTDFSDPELEDVTLSGSESLSFVPPSEATGFRIQFVYGLEFYYVSDPYAYMGFTITDLSMKLGFNLVEPPGGSGGTGGDSGDSGNTGGDTGDTGDTDDSKLDDLINGTPEQNEAADKFAGEMQDKIEDLEGIGGPMDNLEKPVLDPEELVPDFYLSTYYLAFVDVIQCFWATDILVVVIAALCIMFLVSYLLYGKK